MGEVGERVPHSTGYLSLLPVVCSLRKIHNATRTTPSLVTEDNIRLNSEINEIIHCIIPIEEIHFHTHLSVINVCRR